VAIVNGTEIRRSHVADAYDRLPDQYRSVPLEMLFQPLVSSLIETQLVADDARRLNIHKEERFQRALARIENQLLERALLSRRVEEGMTEKALKERYEALVEETSKKVEVRARHILVESEEAAKAVIVDLDKGADFAEAAKKKSKDPSGSSGGDLGYFGEGEMVPAFAQAAFALEVGRFSKAPVRTQFGWHVIKVEDRRKAKAPPYETVEDEIKTQLSRDLGAAFVDGLRKDAKIERFGPDGSPLLETQKPK
jgi:peptidyl-prolyl cis-trans isomerase C